MIYEVSKNKGEGLGYHQKPYNPSTNIFFKASDPSSSSTTQVGFTSCFMHAAENSRILNQSEPMIDNSQTLKDSRSQTQGSKVLRKL